MPLVVNNVAGGQLKAWKVERISIFLFLEKERSLSSVIATWRDYELLCEEIFDID